MSDELKDLFSQRIQDEVQERPQRDLGQVLHRGRQRRKVVWARGASAMVAVALGLGPVTGYLRQTDPSPVHEVRPTATFEEADPRRPVGTMRPKPEDDGDRDPTPEPTPTGTDESAPEEGGPSAFPITLKANGSIAYSRGTDEGMELRATDPDGSGDRTIPTPSGEPWYHAWSPDGSKLAVVIFPSHDPYDHGDFDSDRVLWVMSADGSHPRRLGSGYNVSEPSWSPDGSTIAYILDTGTRKEIHTVRPDGSDDRVLYVDDGRGGAEIFSVKYSPDGTKVLFDRGTENRLDILMMDADGTDVRTITTSGTDYNPSWSPDGTQIVFTRWNVGHTSSSDIFVMDADGGNVRRLTTGGEGQTNMYPHWSPDGRKIVYLAGVTGGPGALVVMDADGSDPVTLVEDEVLGISWQPLPAGSDRRTGGSREDERTSSEEDGSPLFDLGASSDLAAPARRVKTDA